MAQPTMHRHVSFVCTQDGTVLVVQFRVAGVTFQALNGGPDFQFSPAMSLAVPCKDQAQVDHLWDSLSKDGGEPQVCGWLKDKYGISWQIVPER